MSFFDPMEDPRDREARAARESELTERDRQQAIEDLKWMCAHKAGRRFLWALLGRCGVFRNPFHTSGSIMSFRTGEQNVGQELLSRVMEQAPEVFAKMMDEAAEEARRAAKQLETDEPL